MTLPKARGRGWLKFLVLRLPKRIQLYTDLHKLLTGGKLSIKDVLEDMAAIAARRRSGRNRAIVLRDMASRIGAGEKPGDVIAGWVPAEEAAMLVQGQAANRLVESLGELAKILSKQRQIKAALLRAMKSVALLSTTVLLMMVLMSAFVVPKIKSSVAPEVMAKMTYAPRFFAFSEDFIHYLPYWGTVLALVFFVVSRSLPRLVGGQRVWLDDHLPPWSVYRRLRTTMFLTSAASMLDAQITMKDILAEASRIGVPWMRWHASRASRLVAAGNDPVDSLGGGFLPPDTADRLMIYKRLGDLRTIMRSLAADNIDIYEASIATFGATLSSIFKVLLALYILATLGSVFDLVMTVLGTTGV